MEIVDSEDSGNADSDETDPGFTEIRIEEARAEYYRTVREALNKWACDIGDVQGYAEHIPRAPTLLKLLENLALKKSVSVEGKAKVAVVTARFGAPRDKVPEAMVGPCAYIDDVALAALVAQEIAEEVDENVFRQCWPGKEDPRPVIDEVLKFARYAMGTEVWKEVREEFRRQIGPGSTAVDAGDEET